MQLKPGAHFAVGRSTLHVHRLHESAIVVDMNLQAREGGGDFALAACAHSCDNVFAVVFHFGRNEYVGHDVDILDFGVAEFERDSHQVLEAVKLSVDLANKVFRRILGFLGVFGGALLGRILHGGKDFFFFDDAHEAVHDFAVFNQEERGECLNGECCLDFVDARFVDTYRGDLDVAIVFSDTDECGNHDEAGRAAGRRDFEDDRRFGFHDFFFEITVVHLDDFDVVCSVCGGEGACSKNCGCGKSRDVFQDVHDNKIANCLSDRKKLLRFDGFDDFDVGGQPVDGMQFCRGEPLGCLVLQKFRRLAAGNRAKVAVHGQVEGGVVVFHGTKKFTHVHLDGEFFLEFALECLLRGLAAFHFAARELPEPLVFAVAALRSKNLVAILNDSCYNFDMFHEAKFM